MRRHRFISEGWLLWLDRQTRGFWSGCSAGLPSGADSCEYFMVSQSREKSVAGKLKLAMKGCLLLSA